MLLHKFCNTQHDQTGGIRYQVPDFTLVGGSFFLPKTQLVHGTNWWVTAHFPEKQLVHGTKGFIFRMFNPKKTHFTSNFNFGNGF